MVCVAIAALLCHLGRFFGDRLFFGLLPIFSALVGWAFRKLRPPGYRFTPREQILAGLTCLAVLSPVVALRLAWMRGPAASTLEHVQIFFVLLAAGVAPLAIFLFIIWLSTINGTGKGDASLFRDAAPVSRSDTPISDLDRLDSIGENSLIERQRGTP
jgi:hypothetical protein